MTSPKKLPQDLLDALETIAQYCYGEKVAADLITHYIAGRSNPAFIDDMREPLNLNKAALDAGYNFGEKYRSEIPVQLDRSLPSKSLEENS